jgi:hypothetical protein
LAAFFFVLAPALAFAAVVLRALAFAGFLAFVLVLALDGPAFAGGLLFAAPRGLAVGGARRTGGADDVSRAGPAAAVGVSPGAASMMSLGADAGGSMSPFIRSIVFLPDADLNADARNVHGAADARKR